MPTPIELKNRDLVYCDIEDLHCPCPKCEFNFNCYSYDGILVPCEYWCDIDEETREMVRKNKDVYICKNQQAYRDASNSSLKKEC